MGAIPIHIKIGNIETLRTENWQTVPDDRQKRIETIGGEVVQDFGRVEEGDSFSCSVTLKASDADTLKEYWHKRTFVTVRDVGGREIPQLRPVVKKYGYVEHFEEEYFKAELEFWRV